MTDEALEAVLRLLAEGRLTAEEAGPILDALDDDRGRARAMAARPGPARLRRTTRPRARRPTTAPARTLRVHVTGTRPDGHQPAHPAVARPGGDQPGSRYLRGDLGPDPRGDRGRHKGSILEVDDAGDGVRISIE